MKSIFLFVISFLTTTTLWAQNYSDQEMGFDAARITSLLKERGIIDPYYIKSEIEKMRSQYETLYTEKEKYKTELLQKKQPMQLLRGGNLQSVQDVSPAEKEALQALYNSTGGTNWKNKTGWDFSTPVTSWNGIDKTGWYGVQVVDNKIVMLALMSNNLNGFLPEQIGQLKFVQSLDLGDNLISGNIPLEFGGLVSLSQLSLVYNKLEGSIPEEISRLTNLRYMDLSFNNLTKIPSGICSLTNLTTLYLSFNELTGSLPSQIGNMSQLQFLDLKWNNISGTIPLSFYNLEELYHCYMEGNSLSGSLSPEIRKLKKLDYLMLAYNHLSGPIPVEIGQLSRISVIDLQDNELMGSLPSEIGQLQNLEYLNLDRNQISGEIPAAIGQLKNLRHLFMQYNLLSGKVPSEIKNLSKLTSLNLRANLLEGVFPDLTGLYFLGNLDIQSNKFRFIDFENQFQAYKTKLSKFEYKNQARIDAIKTIKVPIGGTVTFTMCEDNRYTPNDTFQWYKNNVLIPGATSREYKVTNLKSTDAGIFFCRSDHTNNPDMSPLFLERETIRLNVINCGTLNGSIRVQQSYDKMYINTESYILVDNLNAALPNIVNYSWEIKDPKGVISKYGINNNLFLYKFTQGGKYDIKVTLTDLDGCTNIFTANANIEPESCTVTNTNSPIIKNLLLTLATKLHHLPAGIVKDGYNCPELDALKPYLLDENPAIFSFEYSDIYHHIGFSFTNKKEHDVVIGAYSDKVMDFDLSKFQRPDELTDINNMIHVNTWVSRIDFCPKELSCVSHVALVVDESGSISATEANKIKKQLKAFVLQQALTNDTFGSNIYVSLTGMSDSDENKRTDFIKPAKVTNTPTSLNQFNKWIDDLGKRKGTGISASSDYWRSGLEGSLSYTMKPNIVIMVTDGCQTADVTGLKQTMKRFNNAPGSDSNLPHLYVVGIEKGFYVDENFYTNKVSDPNNPGTLTNTVTTYLVKSLKYLLDFPETQFPQSDINQFDLATYYGHDDFNLLASDETYFSDKLINANFVCGIASTKDFCDDCLSFKPEPGQEYVLSAWVKEELLTQVKTYENPIIKIVFYNNKEALDIPAQKIDSLSVKASGNIIDGWQRVVKKFRIPANTITIGIQLENNSQNIPVYFDDIRIHPLQGSVKSFVYDPETFKLMSELDENNYSTFYEYDNEGGLVRVKKETEKGIKTIQETRSGSFINTNQ